MEFHLKLPTRVTAGPGSLDSLGEIAASLAFRRTMLVADPGIVGAGYAEQAEALLKARGIDVYCFHDVPENPNGATLDAGRVFAATFGVDSLVALGGGSSLDAAKGVNFLHTGGGNIRDYRGYGKVPGEMLPMIGVPTTAGTGSEAQSYAVLSDSETREKMACGAPGAAFRAVILDPRLLVSAPQHVIAQAGYDAISHAVESFVTLRRTPLSQCFSREAWRLLDANYLRVLKDPSDLAGQEGMQSGAFLAGLAIEHSMLGATHACANPLSAKYSMVHGVAIAILLEKVVRWNADPLYAELHSDLAVRLEELAQAAGLPRRLRDQKVAEADLPELAEKAALQWTGGFNPRSFHVAGALEVYQWAY
jgi:alcohol dehydrogenase